MSYATEDIIGLYDDFVMPTYARQPVAFTRGEGCYLFDPEGKAYLDFITGLSVNNLGHCNPAVVEAVRKQVSELGHVSNLYHTAPGGELARLISENSIGGKVFFSNSGAEANECAIKLARKYGRDSGGAGAGVDSAGSGKHRIIVLENGFHGRTMATLTATAQPAKQEPFKPLLPGFTYVPINDAAALAAAMDADVCAVMLEPVQGEGGVYPLEKAYLQSARELTEANGALLIFDEVQTGMGRTGTLFAYEYSGVEPDVMTLAKGLGGGMPIGATVAAPGYSGVLTAGLHGSTFGGGPVACAAGVAVFGEMLAPGFLESVREKGNYMQSQLMSLAGEGLVTEVRGRGLMWAVELPETDGEAVGTQVAPAAEVVAAALEERIILNNTSATTLRFLPPLMVEAGMIDRVIEFLRTALAVRVTAT